MDKLVKDIKKGVRLGKSITELKKREQFLLVKGLYS